MTTCYEVTIVHKHNTYIYYGDEYLPYLHNYFPGVFFKSEKQQGYEVSIYLTRTESMKYLQKHSTVIRFELLNQNCVKHKKPNANF